MSKSRKAQDTLNGQLNAEDQPKQNSTLAEREQIQGTPFVLINQQDRWFLVMGNHRVTEPTLTKEETLKKLDTERWLLIMHIAIIAIEKMNEMNKLEQYKNHVMQNADLMLQPEHEEINQPIKPIITEDRGKFETV